MLLTPTTPSLPWKLQDTDGGDPLTLYLADVMTVMANLADLPAISVPVGVATLDSTAYVSPIGMQLIGARQHERGLLRAAAALEWYADHSIRRDWPWTTPSTR